MSRNGIDSNSLDEFWNEKTNIIRDFIENHSEFVKLCEEVSYVLKTRMNQSVIEFAYKGVKSAIDCCVMRNIELDYEDNEVRSSFLTD